MSQAELLLGAFAAPAQSRLHPRRLRRAEAARYANVSVGFLEKAALRGDGPPMLRVSRRLVLYDVAEIDAWLESHRRTSTSDSAQ